MAPMWDYEKTMQLPADIDDLRAALRSVRRGNPVLGDVLPGIILTHPDHQTPMTGEQLTQFFRQCLEDYAIVFMTTRCELVTYLDDIEPEFLELLIRAFVHDEVVLGPALATV